MKTNLIYHIDIREFFYRNKSKNPNIKNILDLPFSFFEELKELGVDTIWFTGTFERSEESQRISISMKELYRSYFESLPDWKEEDVIGSPYAIKTYKISKEFGGTKTFIEFKKKLNKLNLKVILDFVPNHFAIDSPYLIKYPELFIQATEELYNNNPYNYFYRESNSRKFIFAHGRDPYFPPWKDTVQLDYRSKSVHEFMMNELINLSKICDGVRCDMAMLLLSDIFTNNWSEHILPKDVVPAGEEFWSSAIQKVTKKNTDFFLIAEAYWNRENDLAEIGFDYVYDKKLYEVIIQENIPLLNEYIKLNFKYKKNRFLFIENHDEQRSAAIFPIEKLKAAATLIYTLPASKLIYDGQLEGRKYRHAIQLKRIFDEQINYDLLNFYKLLFTEIKKSSIQNGYFKFLSPQPAWENNPAYRNFIIYIYENDDLEKDLVVINFSPYQSQCKVKIESLDLINKKFLIKDRLSSEKYIRDGNEMLYKGLYLDLKPYQSQIFEFIKLT